MTHRRTMRRMGVLTAVLTAPALLLPVIGLTSASAAVTPTVRYSDADVVVGKKVLATVPASTRPSGSTLVLQRQFPDGWRNADKTAKKTRHGFVLTVPTSQYGSFAFRVAAKKGSRVVSRSTSRRVTVRPGYNPVGAGDQHVFSTQPKVRWNSCAKIRWTFNPRHAPTKGLKQVKKGFKRVHQATGLEFTYVGKTDRKPNPIGRTIAGDAGRDVIIGWLPPSRYKVFRQNPSTVGHGGNSYQFGWRAGDGSNANRAVKGGVVLNIKHDKGLRNGFGTGFTWGEVIIHEIGHVVGLMHPNAHKQIMYASVINRNAQWGAGDIAGLRGVGDNDGCLKPRQARAAAKVGTFSAF
jgi:hypothetical protein